MRYYQIGKEETSINTEYAKKKSLSSKLFIVVQIVFFFGLLTSATAFAHADSSISKPKTILNVIAAGVMSTTHGTACHAGSSLKGWRVRQNEWAKETIHRWASKNGWQLSWNSQFDRKMIASACFTGSFQHALNKFMLAMAQTSHPLHAELFANRVVLITDLDQTK